MLRRGDLFKRRVLFELSGKYVAKEPKKHLEVLKNELDKMAIKLHHENRHTVGVIKQKLILENF